MAEYKKPEPQAEHRWLHRMLGEWTYEMEMDGEPGTTTKYKGRETVRSLGGLWVQAEATMEASGGAGDTSVLTVGYDTEKKKHVGSFISSGMTMMWLYEGEVDGTGKRLVLRSEGPSMLEEGKQGSYEDVIEFVNDDERTFSSRIRRADGTWHSFMRTVYRRVKSSL